MNSIDIKDLTDLTDDLEKIDYSLKNLPFLKNHDLEIPINESKLYKNIKTEIIQKEFHDRFIDKPELPQFQFVIDSQKTFYRILNNYYNYHNNENFNTYCSLENKDSLVEFIHSKNIYSKKDIHLYELYYKIYNFYLYNILNICIIKINKLTKKNIDIQKYKYELDNILDPDNSENPIETITTKNNELFYKHISQRLTESFIILIDIINNIFEKNSIDDELRKYNKYKILKILFFNIIFISKIFLHDIDETSKHGKSYHDVFKNIIDKIEKKINEKKINEKKIEKIEDVDNLYIGPDIFNNMNILKDKDVDKEKLIKLRLSTLNLFPLTQNLSDYTSPKQDFIETYKQKRIEPCLFKLSKPPKPLHKTYEDYFDHQFDYLFNKYEYGIYRIYDSL